MGKNNQTVHVVTSLRMTGTITPPTDALHMPSCLAQEKIYFLY
jgi:hypothetical protein